MSTLIQTLLQNDTFVLALTGLITAGLSYLGKLVADLLKEKLAGTKYETGALKVTTAVTNAVLMVEQTLVPMAIEAAKDGKITDEEKTKLRMAAWDSLINALGGSDAVTAIGKSMGMDRTQFNTFLSHAIEAAVAKLTK